MGGNAAVFFDSVANGLTIHDVRQVPPIISQVGDVMSCSKYLVFLIALYLTVSIVVSIVNAFCFTLTTMSLFV